MKLELWNRDLLIIGYAVVRDDAFSRNILSKLHWFRNVRAGYPTANKYSRLGGSKQTNLHIIVYEHYFGLTEKGLYVDHKDRDVLNNTPENLRSATPSISSANRGINGNNKCGFKCVVWNQSNKSWRSRIMINFQHIHLGYFKDICDAARAVNDAYRVYYPDVSIPNPGVE